MSVCEYLVFLACRRLNYTSTVWSLLLAFQTSSISKALQLHSRFTHISIAAEVDSWSWRFSAIVFWIFVRICRCCWACHMPCVLFELRFSRLYWHLNLLLFWQQKSFTFLTKSSSTEIKHNIAGEELFGSQHIRTSRKWNCYPFLYSIEFIFWVNYDSRYLKGNLLLCRTHCSNLDHKALF